MRDIHLGLILPSYSDGSTMQIPSISLLAHGLAQRARVTVIPLRNPPSGSEKSLGNVHIVDRGGANLRFRTLLQRTVREISNIHRSSPFDLLHAYWLYEPGFVAAIAGRLVNIPVVASIGGAELAALPEISYGGYRTRRGRFLNRSAIEAASTVTGGSEYVLDLARQSSPRVRAKLRLAPLPVRVVPGSGAGQNPYSVPEAVHLLQVGAFLPVKGQDLTVRAFAALNDDRADLRLTMIGEDPHGYRRRVLALAQQLEVADSITMLKRIPHGALAGYYRHADLLLMPSRHESQGMTVLEAAAHGLPTVGADVGVVRDLAPESAVAVPTNDPWALADAIQRVLSSEKLRRTIGEAARKDASDQYRVGPVVDRWMSIYEEAIRAR